MYLGCFVEIETIRERGEMSIKMSLYLGYDILYKKHKLLKKISKTLLEPLALCKLRLWTLNYFQVSIIFSIKSKFVKTPTYDVIKELLKNDQ